MSEHIENNENLTDAPTLDTLIAAYTHTPTDANLDAVFKALATLPAGSARVRGIQAIAKEKNRHGMSVTEIKACIKAEIEASQSAENPYFENGIFKPLRVVDTLMQTYEFKTFGFDENLRIYKEGCYYIDTSCFTEKCIHGLLGDACKSIYVSDVITLLKQQTKAQLSRHPDWVNLQNGRLCLHTWNLLDHSPAYPSIIQLPITYDPDATCPEFDQWVDSVLPDEDDQFLLLQFFGYAMLQDVRFGKIIVFVGKTHTGKSTCLNLLKTFLGTENVSSKSWHALDNEALRFTRAGLVGKLANISADLSSKYLSGDSQIKQIASGDSMDVELKGKDGFTYTPFATLLASANQKPVSHDRSDAWLTRLIILMFEQQHTGTQADRNVLDRITTDAELSGLLNKVIYALQVLISENGFRVTQSTQQAAMEYEKENNHVVRFFEETYIPEPNSETPESDVYTDYQNWAESEGIKALSKAKLREGLITLGYVRTRPRNNNETRAFIWQGFTYG